jgi:hypothetical protein
MSYHQGPHELRLAISSEAEALISDFGPPDGWSHRRRAVEGPVPHRTASRLENPAYRPPRQSPFLPGPRLPPALATAPVEAAGPPRLECRRPRAAAAWPHPGRPQRLSPLPAPRCGRTGEAQPCLGASFNAAWQRGSWTPMDLRSTQASSPPTPTSSTWFQARTGSLRRSRRTRFAPRANILASAFINASVTPAHEMAMRTVAAGPRP